MAELSEEMDRSMLHADWSKRERTDWWVLSAQNVYRWQPARRLYSLSIFEKWKKLIQIIKNYNKTDLLIYWLSLNA